MAEPTYDNCPACGSRVQVVGGDEGTFFYEPAANPSQACDRHGCLSEKLAARAIDAEARVAELESAIKEARHYLGLAKCDDPNCGGCRHDYEQAWDVLHAALKGKRP